jgi:arsenate reductase
MDVTIYHNPKCGTSRKVLDALQARGIRPKIIEYLKTPPTKAELAALARRMGVSPRDMLRRKGTPYEEMGLDDLTLGDDAILDAIAREPILLERPVVVTPKGARLCRPPERLDEII